MFNFYAQILVEAHIANAAKLYKIIHTQHATTIELVDVLFSMRCVASSNQYADILLSH
jgi:hypothetical protein